MKSLRAERIWPAYCHFLLHVYTCNEPIPGWQRCTRELSSERCGGCVSMRADCRAWLLLLRLYADRLERQLQPAAYRMRRSSDYHSHSTERSSRAIHCIGLLPRSCTAGCARSAPWRHFHFCSSERFLLHCSPCWLHQQWSAQLAHCMLASSREVLRKQLCGRTAAVVVSVQGRNELTLCCLLWSLLPCVCISNSACLQGM